MFDVTAIGDLMVDFTPEGRNSQNMALYACNPGSASAMVLAMNSRLGGRTAFVGKVGRDQFGRFLRKTLQINGIDTTGLVVDSNVGTTLTFARLNDTSGDGSVSFGHRPGADMMLTVKELDKEVIKSGRIFHFGSGSLSQDPCRTTIHTAIRLAKNNGSLISYAPNFRPLLWRKLAEATREMLRVMQHVDVLKVSKEEMQLLTGETEIDRGARQLAGLGPFVVLVTLGARGAFYLSTDASGTLPAYAVNTVDTAGAGDAFLGAVHYRLRGKDVDQTRKLTRAELADIVDFANAAASLTTAKRGTMGAMPSLEEVECCRRTIPTITDHQMAY